MAKIAGLLSGRLVGGVKGYKMIAEGKSLPDKLSEGFDQTVQWALSLDPGFAFLLALPFLVGFAGFFAEYVRQRCAGPHSRNPGTNHGSL